MGLVFSAARGAYLRRTGFLDRSLTAPDQGSSVAVPSAGATAALDLSGLTGARLVCVASAPVRVRAGLSDVGAPTSGDIYLTADRWYAFTLPRSGELSFLRLAGMGAGAVFHWARTARPL